MNEELTGFEKIPRKVYVEINKEKSSFTRTEDGFECVIYGENISNMPIVYVEYDKADKITDKYDFKVETVKKLKVGYIDCYDGNTIKLCITDQFLAEESFIFCFKLTLTELYNYKTIQTFNIVVQDSVIFEVLSREE